MKILELYRDYSVTHATEGHKHCRPGWVQTVCPFCTGNPGMHLGYNIDGNYYYCWRCGPHFIDQTLIKILRVDQDQAKKIIKDYGGIRSTNATASGPALKIRKKAFKYPSGLTELTARHKQYLEKRNFDPEYLESLWELQGTGPIATLKGDNNKIIDYKHRILAPIYWDGEIVSFQARDITDNHPLKYMACPKSRELIHHKHILYGKQSEWKETGICVEGITDVWRFGTSAFATLGIEFTPKQLRKIATFKRVAVVFDGGESQAIKKANDMVGELKFRGVDAFRVDIVGDPGAMDQKEADYLVKQLTTQLIIK